MLQPFIDYLSLERRLSTATVKAYKADLTQWLDFLACEQGDELDLSLVEKAHVRRWVIYLSNQGLDPRSVNRKISSLRTFGRFYKQVSGKSNPMSDGIMALKQKQLLVRALTLDEVDALLGDSQYADNRIGLRDRFMMLTLYTLGLRRMELINLRHLAIDVESKTVRILGKRNKERLLPLLPVWLASYHAYCAAWPENKSWLFTDRQGKKMGERFVYGLINGYLKGASSIETQSPHILRHTFATHLLDMGADLSVIRELLGHINLSATQIYTHASIEQLKRVYEQSHPRGRKDA